MNRRWPHGNEGRDSTWLCSFARSSIHLRRYLASPASPGILTEPLMALAERPGARSRLSRLPPPSALTAFNRSLLGTRDQTCSDRAPSCADPAVTWRRDRRVSTEPVIAGRRYLGVKGAR